MSVTRAIKPASSDQIKAVDVRNGSIASFARRRRVGCFTSSSGHQILPTDLLNNTL
jgi:hypothetical protein